MTSDSSRSVGLVQSRLHELTHGESFLALLNYRFSDDDFSILDEPEATHSPIIMALPDAWHDAMGNSSITRTAYEETEHYKGTKAFLDPPAGFAPTSQHVVGAKLPLTRQETPLQHSSRPSRPDFLSFSLPANLAPALSLVYHSLHRRVAGIAARNIR